MTAVRLIYMTASSAAEAESISQQLIEKRLIACANILGSMTSIYRWKGETRRDAECSVILKTTAERVQSVIEEIQRLHSYETPCALTLNVESGAQQYIDWLKQETE